VAFRCATACARGATGTPRARAATFLGGRANGLAPWRVCAAAIWNVADVAPKCGHRAGEAGRRGVAKMGQVSKLRAGEESRHLRRSRTRSRARKARCHEATHRYTPALAPLHVSQRARPFAGAPAQPVFSIAPRTSRFIAPMTSRVMPLGQARA